MSPKDDDHGKERLNGAKEGPYRNEEVMRDFVTRNTFFLFQKIVYPNV